MSLMLFQMVAYGAEVPCVEVLMAPSVDPARFTPIVLGVLKDKVGHILIGKRRPPQNWIDLWELPGGKVDPGESPEAALKRECKEELGLEVRVGRLLHEEYQRFDHKLLHLRFYEVEALSSRQPANLAHAELAWVLAREMDEYPLLIPGGYKFLTDQKSGL